MRLGRQTVGAIALSGLLLLTGCASTRIVVQTRPASSDVYSATGRLLGKTPLELSAEALKAASEGGALRLRLVTPRFETRELWVNPSQSQNLEVTLTPLSSNYFNERFVRDFSGDINELTRQVLHAQGLLLALKVEQATEAINALQSRFPNVAVSHVLAANLELIRREREKAKSSLRRALSLDPFDADATRLLKRLESEGKR